MTPEERDELCFLPATEIVAAVAGRRLSPVELVDAVLDRMAEINPLIGAFCTPAPERARARAALLADSLVRGGTPGPLAGVPLGVKDLIATAGLLTTFGSPAYRDHVPDQDDIVVERGTAAGAVVLGKTNTTEFGYSPAGHNPLFPPSRNPWRTDLTPGGSSAGSAAAVAAGLGPVALGSDGGCSLRVPAAFCELVGFKPSMGRVPVWPSCRDEGLPGASGWESIEHLGVLTRTVADTALMLSVLAGPDPRDRHSIPCQDVEWTAAARRGTAEGCAGLRIAYSPDLGYLPVDPAVRAVAEEAVAVFRGLGCTVEEVDPGWSDPAEAFQAVITAETDLTGMRRLVDQHGSTMSPHLVAWMTRDWTARELTDANIARKALTNRMAALMSAYDLLITPTAAVPPFPVGVHGPEHIAGRAVGDTAWIGFNYPASLTGAPAMSVPAGRTPDDLPVGLQLIGRHLADGTVLRAAAAYESVRPWAHRRPRLSPDGIGSTPVAAH
ncbi:amidase [Streptomyces sp. NBC_00102]|uniref:amidase n=1 Tax=Streptomyces sp. NBC_00102 TaxID=2975652 RepID=UPI00225C2F9D|nr:amidase family protein [Streptomyces sp. NBC_00102]MCX5395539.1 amidase family protein [Streptomyces sp. NBC_00102]